MQAREINKGIISLKVILKVRRQNEVINVMSILKERDRLVGGRRDI